MSQNSYTSLLQFKVVLHSYYGWFFGVKVETVILIGGRWFSASMRGLNERTYCNMSAQSDHTCQNEPKCVSVTRNAWVLAGLSMISMMTFTQIMAIWTPGITLQDHLNVCSHGRISIPIIIEGVFQLIRNEANTCVCWMWRDCFCTALMSQMFL